MITVELAHMQMQHDLPVLNRLIPDHAFIAAMDPMSGSPTHGTMGRTRYSFTGEHQTLDLLVVRKQTETAQMRKKDL